MTNPQLATVPKDLRHSSSSECTISLSSSANDPTNIPTPFPIYIIILNINISAYDLWITTPRWDLGEHYCSPALHCYFRVLWREQTWLFCEIIEKWHVTAQTWTTNTWKKKQTANIRQQTSCSPGTVQAWGLVSKLIIYVWCIYTHPWGWRADA